MASDGRMVNIDRDDIIRYVEYVPEVSQPPDYDKAIQVLKKTTTRK